MGAEATIMISLTQYLIDEYKKRIEKKISRVPESGCWIWTGSSDKYGRIRFGTKWKKAHKISYMCYKGPVPDGVLVLHKCDVKLCVNPDHLYLGDMKDNARDTVDRGLNHEANKTYCKRGHPLFGKNLHQTSKQRVCKACVNLSQKASKLGLTTEQYFIIEVKLKSQIGPKKPL